MIDRRRFLQGSGVGLALLGMECLPRAAFALQSDAAPGIIPIRFSNDLITHITVCLRPFRRQGPRIELEKLGAKTVVHNYGHGGSGWSLSWGSAAEAMTLASGSGEDQVAVIGAGAIGLTTAITAQRMGKKVTIYAKEQFPNVRSARATGTWSPDSRIAMRADIDEAFGDQWERMARTSAEQYKAMIGKGDGVEITDRYFLGDPEPEAAPADTLSTPAEPEPESPFADDLHTRIGRPFGSSQVIEGGLPPFATPYVRLSHSLTFNVTQLSQQLVAEFKAGGGKIIPMEFHEPSDLMKLKQKLIFNCTGYGARALWRDESVIPVRGQIGWMAPQPASLYGVYYRGAQLLSRGDGVLIQEYGPDDFYGFNIADETPDPEETRKVIERLQPMWRVT